MKLSFLLFGGAAALAPQPVKRVDGVQRRRRRRAPDRVRRRRRVRRDRRASRGIYGGIADLKDAVEKGDFAAVLAEKNAFDLFNSGAYAQKSAITKAQKAIAVTETKNIMEAIASKNANQLKTSYAAYMKNAAIDTKPVDVSTGQGYSNDYDWKVRTKKGAIYQR
ncbi:xanthine dehydrogenase [Aureococcus anophagefferens]|nr:xanthine dehydrogenase [Aureococcus anophagefferens]